MPSFRPGSYAPGNFDTQRRPGPPPWTQERVNYNSVEEQNKREGVSITTPGQGEPPEPQNGPASAQPLSEEATYDELMEQAQEKDIEGRSSMNKEELVQALTQDEEPKGEDGEKDGDETKEVESGAISATSTSSTEGEGDSEKDDEPKDDDEKDDDPAKKAAAKKATATKKATMKKAATKKTD